MDGGSTCIPNNKAPAKTGEVGQQFGGAHCGIEGAGAKADRFIAVIESRTFIREVIRRGMQPAFSLPLVMYSAASEIEGQFLGASPAIVMLSLTDASKEACVSALKILAEFVPGVPIVVLASANDANLARIALHHGARGYIPCTMGFEIAVEAMRFVLAGGTYAPTDCLLAIDRLEPQISEPFNGLTNREVGIVRGIRHGKPNKVIAYELNISDSTVKAHVRNVMWKLRARNRTELAVKAQTDLVLDVQRNGRAPP
jgi:DNA-binding NarL/FixJ family response regulator